MARRQHIPEGILPAEGRSDVAGDLEEEQRNAYSAHHMGAASHKGKATRKAQTRQKQGAQEPCMPALDDYMGPPYPVEGRSDIAEDLEEEQRNAYSAHRGGAYS